MATKINVKFSYLCLFFITLATAGCGGREILSDQPATQEIQPTEITIDQVPATTQASSTTTEEQSPFAEVETETPAQNYRVPECLTQTTVPCLNPAPYEDPACFMETVQAEIDAEKSNNTNFYVAIEKFQDECPWEEINGSCPWGSDDHDGLSLATPLATTKKALERMNEHKKNGSRKGHYTLILRGGDFTYGPLVISGYSFMGGQMYKGPHLYDDDGYEVKSDSTFKLYYHGDPGYETANRYIVSDITVQPYNGETVTLDGQCEFTPPTGSDGLPVTPGHSEWKSDDTQMVRTCSSALWGDPVTDLRTMGFYSTMGMVSIHYAHRIEIENLTIQNAPSFGAAVYGYSKNIRFTGNLIKNTYASGFYAADGPDGVIFNNNSVSYACAGSAQENVSFGRVSNAVVMNNTISDGYNDAGIDVKAGYHQFYVGNNELHGPMAMIYIDAESEASDYIWVNGNYIHDNTYGDCIRLASEWRGSTEYVKISNNICSNTLRGIWIAGYFHQLRDLAGLDPTVVGVPMQHVLVTNNTVYMAGNETMGYGAAFEMTNPGATDVTVINNIFTHSTYNTTYFQNVFSEDGSLSTSIINFSNNITYCAESSAKDEDGNLICLTDNGYELPGDITLQVDPLFVDPNNGDFHLQTGSPAINKGMNIEAGPVYDYECDLRSYGENLTQDLGADEYYPTP